MARASIDRKKTGASESAKPDYSAAVSQICRDDTHPRRPLSVSLVWQAGLTIDRLYPPQHEFDAFRILASLNLLNAAVKTRWGRQLVSYGYIKGMAACMFVCLTARPVRGVTTYYNPSSDVVYFRVMGIQISFHHIPCYLELRNLLACRHLQPQEWDGLRLQHIPTELFRLANPTDLKPGVGELNRLRNRMQHFQKPSLDFLWRLPACQPERILARERLNAPIVCPPAKTLFALGVALRFNIWHATRFELFRRRERRPFRVMRYDGTNYQQLMRFLIGNLPNIPRRSEQSLQTGKLYCLSPRRHVISLSPSQFIVALCQNSHLRLSSRRVCNLCVTYDIALYLTHLYPRLRFVSTLNVNHRRQHRRYYSHGTLLRLPPDALARRLKVWVPYDPQQLLANFPVENLPLPLVAQYADMPDHVFDFDILGRPGCMGLMAFGRYQLLDECYRDIRIRNNHARVQDASGRWAVYSIGEERFKSDFVYDRIWFDNFASIIYGLRDETNVDIICNFFPNRHAFDK